MRYSFGLILLCSLLWACSDGGNSVAGAPVAAAAQNPYPDYQSENYAGLENWLCHAGLTGQDNVCNADLGSTIVYADGSSAIETFIAASAPAVDCFYVYPTVSGDATGNSDFEEGEEEVFTTVLQAARYSAHCRVFAPVYRQTTVGSIFLGLEGDPELAYGDVLDAFRYYIAHENNGRGFLLIGHSQGSFHLRRLIAEEVETEEYLMERLVSAHLLGASMQVPEGADVGGSFQQVPVCRTGDQNACVLSYATYRDTDPFLAAGQVVFGRPGEGTQAVCTNPAALMGGSAFTTPYIATGTLPALEAVLIKRSEGPYAEPELFPPLTTPFYTLPDFLQVECTVNDDGISYLELHVLADPTDPRTDDINGEFIGGDGWGLHLVDMSVGLGDLVTTAGGQIAAWLEDQ